MCAIQDILLRNKTLNETKLNKVILAYSTQIKIKKYTTKKVCITKILFLILNYFYFNL